MMLDAQMGVTKTKAKPKKDPFSDFINSMYWIQGKPEEYTPDAFKAAIDGGAKWGFPVGAIKQAANSAAYRMGWVKNQMALRGAYFLKSECGEVAWIRGSVPVMREDMVKVGMGSSDLRYRPMFENWYCDLTLSINTGFGMTFDDIINVINAGGAGVGVGEWRPERDGIFGMYHVEIVK